MTPNSTTDILGWLLAGTADEAEIRKLWFDDPEQLFELGTGATFDAAILPRRLGREVHQRLELAMQRRVPAALVEDGVAILVGPRSAWSELVPAAVTVRRGGDLVRLPHPEHPVAWLRHPRGLQPPGFLLIPSLIHQILLSDHYLAGE